MGYFDKCRNCLERRVGCQANCNTYKTALKHFEADKQKAQQHQDADRYEDANGWKRR